MSGRVTVQLAARGARVLWMRGALLGVLCSVRCATVTDLDRLMAGADRPLVVQVVGTNTGLTIGVPGGATVALGRQHFVVSVVRGAAGPDAATRLTLADNERVGRAGAGPESVLSGDITLRLEIAPESHVAE